jgi:hypothetical protein
MNERKPIPIDQLEVGCWYVGRGRNANIGQWSGDDFLVIAQCGNPVSWKPRKWITTPCIKREPYCTKEEGCFQPFLKIDEGEMIETFGDAGWDAHYGYTMRFNKLEGENNE